MVILVRSLSASSPLASRPDAAEPLVDRLEHAVIDDVERLARLRQFAQHELHELAGFGPGHDEADHCFEHRVQPRLRRLRRPLQLAGRPAPSAGPAMPPIVSTM